MTAEEWQAAAAIVAIVLSVGTAIVGWRHAINANRAARETNATAERALALAQSAEDRAQRLEDRDVEPRDVRWEVAKRQDVGDRFGITNVGTDNAYDVILVVHPSNQARREARHPELPPDGRLGVDLSDIAEEKRERARRRSDVVLFLGTSITLRASVTWKSHAGVPSTHDFGRMTI